MKQNQARIDLLLNLLAGYENDVSIAEDGVRNVQSLLLKEGYDGVLSKNIRISNISIRESKINIEGINAKVIKLIDGISKDNFKEATIPKKILYALNEIRSGDYKEVAKKLLELDPESFDNDKAEKDCRNFLSKFNVDGIIHSKTNGGRKNTYYI
jgi:hypothetical protein